MTKIYFLHKGDNIPFYVGETSQPLKYRLNHHKRSKNKTARGFKFKYK